MREAFFRMVCMENEIIGFRKKGTPAPEKNNNVFIILLIGNIFVVHYFFVFDSFSWKNGRLC